MDLLYFILLTSTLIFIHESGHFFVAKLFGVKVLTFSIGFGPKIIRVRGKETEYCIGLLPFGGFVNMLEEGNATKPIPPEERPRTYEAQASWKRVLIVLAGPMMNLIFPIAIYTAVYLEDRQVLPAVVGTVTPGKPADGVLQPGDRILSVAGHDVSTFQEVQRLVSKRANEKVALKIERDGREVELEVTPHEEIEAHELDLVDRVGRAGISPYFPQAVIGIAASDSPAYRAGLRTFDRIVLINGKRVDRYYDVVSLLALNKGETLLVTYMRPILAPSALGGLAEVAVLEPQLATLTPRERVGDQLPITYAAREKDLSERVGIESADRYAAFVPVGSSEWKAGLRAGDRLTALDGKPISSWNSFRTSLFAEPQRLHSLAWARLGEPMAGVFQLRKEEWNDEYGQHYNRYVFRSTRDLPNALDRLVPNPNVVLQAISRGIEETGHVVRFVSVGMLRVLQGKISLLSSMTGPITIFEIAGEAGAKGTTFFLWAMAVISINLGIVNLLPIPVLDGGHLLFMLIETVKRQPLSLRTRQLASLGGMIMLGALMTIAFRNDVVRKWPEILGQLKELFS